MLQLTGPVHYSDSRKNKNQLTLAKKKQGCSSPHFLLSLKTLLLTFISIFKLFSISSNP